MKKIFLLLMVLGPMAIASAQDRVQVVTGDNSTDYLVEELLRISFTEDGITMLRSDETGDTYAIEEVSKILFHPTSTAVTTVMEPKMTLFVARDGSTVSVRGWQGERATVNIYSINGQRVYGNTNWQGSDIDISGLEHGIYVITVDGKSTKFRK